MKKNKDNWNNSKGNKYKDIQTGRLTTFATELRYKLDDRVDDDPYKIHERHKDLRKKMFGKRN